MSQATLFPRRGFRDSMLTICTISGLCEGYELLTSNLELVNAHFRTCEKAKRKAYEVESPGGHSIAGFPILRGSLTGKAQSPMTLVRVSYAFVQSPFSFCHYT